MSETCRYCGVGINFIRWGGSWDWCAERGTALCAATNSRGWHYPINPVEGIDY